MQLEFLYYKIIFIHKIVVIQKITARYHGIYILGSFGVNGYTDFEQVDIKKVDKQLTYAMHVKDRYANGTFIDKLTKWISVILIGY